MKDLAALEDECLRKWRAQRPNLIADGAADADAYMVSSPKLLFVLKEVNDPEAEEAWDLREFLCDGAQAATWNNVSRWVLALGPGGNQKAWHEVETVNAQTRTERLRSIAAINVKKTPGGASADSEELKRYAEADQHFLERQFEIYQADFAVLCGVVPRLVPQLRGIDPQWTTRGVEYREYEPGRYGISFWHPQARYPAKLLYYALADAADELRKRGGA